MAGQRARRPRLDIDYYRVLEVSASASEDEIRRSYRKLALEAHPDKNPGRREWAERRIRELIEAYEVLSDPQSRDFVDRQRKASGAHREAAEPFFFHRTGPGARALLILHHLLHGRPEDAIALILEQEELHGDDYLEKYLAREDYLDSLFLLAEHHLEKKDYLAAARSLRTFYHTDSQSARRRHYHDEVVRRLKDLYLKKIPRTVDSRLRVVYLDEAREFALTEREEIARLEMLVAACVETGMRSEAAVALARLRSLSPTRPGLDDLEARVSSLQIPPLRRGRRA